VSGCTSLPDLVDEGGDASLLDVITLADGGHAIVESDGAVVPTGDDTNPVSDGSTGTMTGSDGSTGMMPGDDDASMSMTDSGGTPTDGATSHDTGAPDTGTPDAGPPVCVAKTSCAGANADCSGCASCAESKPSCVTCQQITCNGSTPTGQQCCVTNGGAYCATRSGIFATGYSYACQ
jgi:hypothetical protein